MDRCSSSLGAGKHRYKCKKNQQYGGLPVALMQALSWTSPLKVDERTPVELFATHVLTSEFDRHDSMTVKDAA
ncbi:hypothetical protein TNCV_4878171 [Trichonephila clavipes]|nr:hypothetical protein TNCV_4878171 [Trichonephila clavipes]